MSAIYERITAFNSNRLPAIVKLKYKAMAANVFGFYRGTCHLFYEDLASAKDPLPVSPVTWVCGDLHLENFGSYKGDNRQVYFDLNDFDESALAPAAYELTRMLTSIIVAFDSLGFSTKSASKTAERYLKGYCETLGNGKAKSIDPRTAEGITRTFLITAETRKQKQLLQKGTVKYKGKLSLLLDERHFKLEKQLRKELISFVKKWIKTSNYNGYNFKVSDAVFRIAGTGSIGVKRYLFLLKSRNTKGKYLLLDMKQALPSCLGAYLQTKQPQWLSEAERVIAVQQRMQNVSPALLSAATFKGEPCIIKQMQPVADKINFELLKDRYDEINQVIDDMAKLTASAQLRSAGRQGSAIADDLIEFGNNDNWQSSALAYAIKYSKQVKKDYQQYMERYGKGLY